MTTGVSEKAKVWVEFLSEGAASKRVDMRLSLHITKGDLTLLIVHKHPHLLGLFSQREEDIWGGQSLVLISIPQPYSLESILLTQCDPPFSDDKLCLATPKSQSVFPLTCTS